MTGHVRWDRDAYIERVGGSLEAERRRNALMARQGGYRLAEERRRHGLTQAQLAQAMGISPGRVSQIERGEVATIEAVARYVEGLGGRLDLVATFGEHITIVATTEARMLAKNVAAAGHTVTDSEPGRNRGGYGARP